MTRIIKKFIKVEDINSVIVEEFYYPETFLEWIKSLWQFKYANVVPPMRDATKEELTELKEIENNKNKEW